jgi:xylulokinase
VAHHPGSSLGAAFIAGMGAGVFSDWGEIERFIRISGVIEPDRERHERYEKFFALYRDLYESLKPQFLSLQRISGEQPLSS